MNCGADRPPSSSRAGLDHLERLLLACLAAPPRLLGVVLGPDRAGADDDQARPARRQGDRVVLQPDRGRRLHAFHAPSVAESGARRRPPPRPPGRRRRPAFRNCRRENGCSAGLTPPSRSRFFCWVRVSFSLMTVPRVRDRGVLPQGRAIRRQDRGRGERIGVARGGLAGAGSAVPFSNQPITDVPPRIESRSSPSQRPPRPPRFKVFSHFPVEIAGLRRGGPWRRRGRTPRRASASVAAVGAGDHVPLAGRRRRSGRYWSRRSCVGPLGLQRLELRPRPAWPLRGTCRRRPRPPSASR